MKKGFVALVGAGPGNLGLFTLRGKECLQKADVVVYDRLVSDEILNLIPLNARKIDVGKKSSFHLVAQSKINEILLKEALEGNYVVRLKGGEPFLFGRGGEELELLVKNSVLFEVVPGITSAIAVPSYAGIPVTHRDFCSSIHIITGHQKNNEPIKINFEALVKIKGTLIFLMGVASLNAIMQGLISGGMDEDTPAAVVQNGTGANQRKVIATVKTLEEKAKDISSPAVIIVGEVCSLSHSYDWFSALPLFGTNIIVTRPKASQGTLSDRLKNLGACVYDCPCIEIKEIEDNKEFIDALEKIQNFKWVVFTSKNGVDIFFDKLKNMGKDCRCLGNMKIAAIGSQTMQTLLNYGIIGDYMPEIFDGEHLAKGLVDLHAENVLLLRAKKGSEEITKILGENNIDYLDVPIYNTYYIDDCADEIKKLTEKDKIYVTFTAASTVEGFCEICADPKNVFGICIGNQTAKAAKKHNIPHIISQSATIDSMIDKILEAVNENKTTQIKKK